MKRNWSSSLLSTVSNDVSSVSSKVEEVEVEVIENRNAIELNTASIDELISDGEIHKASKIDVNVCILVDKLAEFPVGTILSWVMKVDNNGGEFVDLPSGWVRCDGGTIPNHPSIEGGSIWAGKTIPNLNGERRFLRGGDDAKVLTLEDDQLQSHEHVFNDPGHTHPYVDKHTTWRDGNDGHWGPNGADRDNDRFDQPHDRTTANVTSGITVTGVKDARHGDETRVKNMSIIWIIPIW